MKELKERREKTKKKGNDDLKVIQRKRKKDNKLKESKII